MTRRLGIGLGFGILKNGKLRRYMSESMEFGCQGGRSTTGLGKMTMASSTQEALANQTAPQCCDNPVPSLA